MTLPFHAATLRWFERSFHGPTRVQSEGWPVIASGEHALLLAPTGSGKTLAAFLSAIDGVMQLPEDAEPGYRVLYVSPLKALVYDVERNLRAPLVGVGQSGAALGTPLRTPKVDVRTGDTPQSERRRQLRSPGDILVTTPESLFLLLGSKASEGLKRVHTVIIDEIHAVAGTKRGVHLALTLERLSALTEVEPQRIGLSATQRPLEEIARFLGGDRPVRIVDTSEPPQLDLEIVVPVEDMTHPVVVEAAEQEGEAKGISGAQYPSSVPRLKDSIWPTIYPRLLELIRAHRSTIVFTNSRLLCERLTLRLNEAAGEELVRAHHGSVARAQREVIEEALKQGQLACIVATSSLELGIDMGAVDLVIQIESPGSVARGLQRIGRAGHGVGEVSVGKVFPKFRGDLLECAVVARAMAEARIESTRVPRNCLDVLSQQVVAMVAQETLTVDVLEARVRRAYPYSKLSRAALVSVLDMLSGRFPSEDFADLTPRIVWDRTADTLTARKGAGTLALLNAGTIPDRGMYGVFLAGEGGGRLGELDEELVFESRPGDHLILGASTWRVTQITRDRVEVVPAPGQPGRLPFWRGDRPGRPYDLGVEMGAFVRELAALTPAKGRAWLAETTPLNPAAARNLVAYVQDQKLASDGVVPTDQTLVVERFRDELGDWRVCIHSCFGGKVNAPWALALDALLSTRAGFEVQTMWTDDGVVLRFADMEEPPTESQLFPDPDEVEELILEQLQHSAIFAARFREAAGRSLLMPKKRWGKRTPLWAQRLKAQQLQQVAQQHSTFPIILEVVREVLQDVFDVPKLVELLRAVRRRDVRVEEVETRSASPFARGLVFAYVSTYLYEGDAPLAERRAAALTLDRELLRDLLGAEELRELLSVEAVAEVEASLQYLTPERQARHADALHDVLRRLGALTPEAVAARCSEPPDLWLAELERHRRAYRAHVAGREVWIADIDAARYRDALGVVPAAGLPSVFLEPADEPLEALLRRYARTHAPFTAAEAAEPLGLLPAQVEAVLRGLVARNELLHGELRPGGRGREFCDPEVMRRLKRASLARLRSEVAPVDAPTLARFLPRWHGLDGTRGGGARLREVVDQLEGLPIPFSALESEVLPARVPHYSAHLLDELGATGEVVWVGCGALGSKDGRVALYRREHVPLLHTPMEPEELSPTQASIVAHLERRGAVFLAELQGVLPDVPARELVDALWTLVWQGVLTNDTFQPLRGLSSPARRTGRGSGASRVAGGRWSLVRSMVWPVGDTERAAALVNMLLERYGVVSREAALAEEIPGGWSSIYPVLRAMEEGGKARRGWFVDGLSGAQFARPGVVDRLRHSGSEEASARVLAVTDPANPYGRLLSWPAHAGKSTPARKAGAVVVLLEGHPVLYATGGCRRITTFSHGQGEPSLEGALRALAVWAQGESKPRVERIDGEVATEHSLVPLMLRCGFALDDRRLVLSHV